MIYTKSGKQKLNTKSSTESEVVGVSDIFPMQLWTKLFIEAQGYLIAENENNLYQDNTSAIRIEQNGRASCGPKSRHINIRYFFVAERAESEGINIIYCPTEKMVADFFTKPLQGALFRRFRDIIMGVVHPSDAFRIDDTSTVTTTKERVGVCGCFIP